MSNGLSITVRGFAFQLAMKQLIFNEQQHLCLVGTRLCREVDKRWEVLVGRQVVHKLLLHVAALPGTSRTNKQYRPLTYNSHIFCQLLPLPSTSQYLSCENCLQHEKEYYRNCSVTYCILQLCTSKRTLIRASLTSEQQHVGLHLRFACVFYLYVFKLESVCLKVSFCNIFGYIFS